jgi:hypothetical protein
LVLGEKEFHERNEVIPPSEEHDGECEKDREKKAAIDDKIYKWVDSLIGNI